MTIGQELWDLIRLVYDRNHDGQMDVNLVKPYLSERIAIRVIPKNGFILRGGEAVSRLYFVISGSYCVVRNSMEGVSNLVANRMSPQFIGIDQIVNEKFASYSSIVSIKKCVVLEIDKQYFIECIRNNGDIAMFMIGNLCEKLVRSNHRMDRLIFHSAEDNLKLYICRYAQEHPGENGCRLNLKNRLIADEIGIHIRTLYRAVSMLKEQGLVYSQNGCIAVTKEQLDRIRAECENFE